MKIGTIGKEEIDIKFVPALILTGGIALILGLISAIVSVFF